MATLVKIMFAFGLSGILYNPLMSIRHLMDFWSDGTIEAGQLIDKSGNGRNAAITDSLITNQDALLGSSFINNGGTAVPPTLNISLNASPPSGFSGYYSRVGWTVSSGSGLVRTENFVSISGETQRYRFYYRRNTATFITWGLRPGNGSGTIASGNFSGGAVGVWTEVTGTAAVTSSGGLAHLFLNVGVGTHEVDIFFPEGDGVTVDGQTGIGFVLPVDATLAAIDATGTQKTFYSATTGFPLTTRAAYQYNALTDQIYCGGATSYIFLSTNPSISTYDILANSFEDVDHAFDSCPIELTVGSGGTYALPQSAINIAHSGDFRNRRRIKFLSDVSVTTYAGYTVVSGGGYMSFIQMNKFFDYLTSDGTQRTITATKQDSLNDTQSSSTEVLAPIYSGGWRGLNIEKSNGGYIWHQDFTGMLNQIFIMKDCTFNENGAQAIFDYRTANALPQPAIQMSFNTLAGGMHNNFILKLENVTLKGMRPYTWQDVACTSGNGGKVYMNNCTLDNEIIYDPVSNPTSEIKESIRLTSSGGGRDTQIFMTNTTRNSTVLKIGAVESIFLTEL